MGQQLRRQRDLSLDLAFRVHLIDRMRNQPVAAAFRGEPEPALAIRRNPLEVQLLRRIAAAGRQQPSRDLRRGLRRVDGVDHRRRAIDTVRHRRKLARLGRVGCQTRQHTPAQQAFRARRGDHRIGRRPLGQFIDHHMRAHTAVADEIHLIGGGEQVATRDCHHPLGQNPRRQQGLAELFGSRQTDLRAPGLHPGEGFPCLS